MKTAIIGSGISGLTAAMALHRDHAITLYEAGSYVGGHTHTVPVREGDREVPVDTGFIVFNDWTYPHFVELLSQLRIASRPSAMSFSVQCERTGLEYNGTSLNTLFAQRSNLLRPGFYRMLVDILRFNREAPDLLTDAAGERPLGHYLREQGYSRQFVEHYIVPMGAAIWSSPAGAMLDFPARFFVRFFRNHGFLNIDDRPTWRVVDGGSWSYVKAMLERFGDRVRLDTPVRLVERDAQGVTICLRDGQRERFDEVIFACHSDQALSLLAEPSAAEREILGAIPYQPNDAVLHTDTSLMPRRELAWASWNCHLPASPLDRVALTYNMNLLQGLDCAGDYLVTLNYSQRIDPRKVLARMTYTHPLFTLSGMQAQARWSEISGQRGTHYCGAYWRNGFHEDGVMSALRVCRQLGAPMARDFAWSWETPRRSGHSRSEAA